MQNCILKREAYNYIQLDPSRLQDSCEAGLHAANLEDACELVLKSLMQNLHQLPLQFQDILAVMRKSVQEKYPDFPDAAYTSVGNFLFLRFLVPVLLSPCSFDLIDGNSLD